MKITYSALGEINLGDWYIGEQYKGELFGLGDTQ